MTKEEKETYLTDAMLFKASIQLDAINGTNIGFSKMDFLSRLPKSLFKYRQFDEFSIEMIEDRYLYLCPAEKLDDPFECLVDIDVSKFFDENRNTINGAFYKSIVELVLRFAPETQREQMREVVYACTTAQYSLDTKKARDYFYERQGEFDRAAVSMVINYIGGLPDQFRRPENQREISRLIKFSIDARREIGICSLCEEPTSQVMWAMYAGGYQGYCIEYDFEHSVEAAIETFPVLYENDRQNNAVVAIISMFINNLANALTKGKIGTNQTQYIRMFLTKSEEWSFQNEWRVIGKAEVRIPAPPIKAIYIGHKASEANIKVIKELSESMGFDVFKTTIDPATLRIGFLKQ